MVIREKELLLSNQVLLELAGKLSRPGMGFPRPLSPHHTSPHPDLDNVVIQDAASSRGRCDGATVLVCAGVHSLCVGLGGRGGAGSEVAPACGRRGPGRDQRTAQVSAPLLARRLSPSLGDLPSAGFCPAALRLNLRARPVPQSRACLGTPLEPRGRGN